MEGQTGVQLTRDENGCLLKLAGSLDIGSAEELRKALQDSLSGGPALSLDLSELEGCDAAVLQLVCSACKTGERLSKPVRIQHLSPGVEAACAAIGLPTTELATGVGANTGGGSGSEANSVL